MTRSPSNSRLRTLLCIVNRSGSLGASLLLMMALFTLPGCDQIQNAIGNATGDADAPAEPVTQDDAQPAPVPVRLPVEPTKPDPAEVIEGFVNMDPADKTDASLKALAELESGIQNVTIVDLTGAKQVTAEGIGYLAKLPFITDLKISRLQLPPGSFQPIGNLNELESLDASYSSFNDSDVRTLADKTSIKTLILRNSRLTDAGLEMMSGLTNLETLDVAHTPINGSGFAKMRARGSLVPVKRLNVSGTRFGDAGWKPIQGLPNLEELYAASSGTDSTALLGLRGLNNLRVLNLHRNVVDDDGMKHIAKLKSIEELSVAQNSKITDRGVGLLKSKKQLTVLALDGTKVSKNAVEALRTKYLKDTQIGY